MSTRLIVGSLCLVAVLGSLVMAVRAAHDGNAPGAQAAAPAQAAVLGDTATIVIHKPDGAQGLQVAALKAGADDEDGAEGGDDDEDSEQAIPVSQVPDVVMQAALAALPGFAALEAESEQHGDKTTYSIEGTSGDKRYEIELSSTGAVLEVEASEGDD